MGSDLIQSMSLMSSCNKQLHKATTRLIYHYHNIKFTSTHLSTRIMSFISSKIKKSNKTHEEVNKEEVLWKKTILMGEKCEPLDFNGVVHYDCEGKRLDHVPPRSPRNSSGGFNYVRSLAEGRKHGETRFRV